MHIVCVGLPSRSGQKCLNLLGWFRRCSKSYLCAKIFVQHSYLNMCIGIVYAIGGIKQTQCFYIEQGMCHRWLLRRKMRQNECETAMTKAISHPAVNAVKNYLSGSENCLVVWGLYSSKTSLCCQAIAHGINQAGGLAKWMRCDEMVRTNSSLKQVLLTRLGCQTLDDFARLLPDTTRCEHIWLIFDAVNTWNSETIGFFKELIELSYARNKFRVLLFTHETDVACSLLKWSSAERPIQMVEPIGCCRRRTACNDDTALFASPDSNQVSNSAPKHVTFTVPRGGGHLGRRPKHHI